MNNKVNISPSNDEQYYVYKHMSLDSDDVFYVGYGEASRPYSKSGRSSYWHSRSSLGGGYRVEVYEKPLTKEDALLLEAKAIAKYDAINPLANINQSFILLPVISYDKSGNYIRSFKNSVEAAKHYSTRPSYIEDACMYQYRSHRECYWRYYEDMGSISYSEVIEKSRAKIYDSVPRKEKKKSTKSLTTRKIYDRDIFGNERHRTLIQGDRKIPRSKY